MVVTRYIDYYGESLNLRELAKCARCLEMFLTTSLYLFDIIEESASEDCIGEGFLANYNYLKTERDSLLNDLNSALVYLRNPTNCVELPPAWSYSDTNAKITTLCKRMVYFTRVMRYNIDCLCGVDTGYIGNMFSRAYKVDRGVCIHGQRPMRSKYFHALCVLFNLEEPLL